LRHGANVEAMSCSILEHPQHRRQFRRGRLEQGWEVDIEGTETHAVFAQLSPRRLVEGANLLRDLLAAQHTEVLPETKGDAAREPGDVLRGIDLHQRLQALTHEFGEPGNEAFAHLLLVRGWQVLVSVDDDRGLERVLARLQPSNLRLAPQNCSVAR